MEYLADSAKPGLRDRKKARRRDEIIAAARELFAAQGIDATTMADIAAAAEVSAPTLFNYFGSKDGILIAMISEGTREARERDRGQQWQDGADLVSLVVALFLRVSSRTLDVAGKRVWRHAEAAAIRQPDTALSREYRNVSDALKMFLAGFLSELDLQTRAGRDCPPEFLAELLIDRWMPCFIQLITSEERTLAEHEAVLQAQFAPLIRLLFTDACVDHPRRKESRA
ncbi:TetR/AcrR family transcriptional regulator [Neotabrizicola shimadae]|uniref:TetR/AcrR family transcriptional regulator n=2 Tax=Neotabrizicola shimadae TaxID=2807096 RepID=A0A8G0ZRC9_9RHOB|nr:TetR/AcrR family transcriptional regulator [Neotabrizicola shimadae]QYZ70036.1 TetR/AcrR family transcriptional regulator [Neotabrizicola shimadae]